MNVIPDAKAAIVPYSTCVSLDSLVVHVIVAPVVVTADIIGAVVSEPSTSGEIIIDEGSLIVLGVGVNGFIVAVELGIGVGAKIGVVLHPYSLFNFALVALPIYPVPLFNP